MPALFGREVGRVHSCLFHTVPALSPERIVATMLHNLANNRRGKANGRFLLRSESIKKFKNELNYDMKRFPRMNTSLESISPINNKKEGKRVPCVNRASHAVIVGRF